MQKYSTLSEEHKQNGHATIYRYLYDGSDFWNRKDLDFNSFLKFAAHNTEGTLSISAAFNFLVKVGGLRSQF